MKRMRPGAIRASFVSAIEWLLQEWWLVNTIVWLAVIYAVVRLDRWL